MLKTELESLVMRNDETLPQMAFEEVERYYMSANIYHQYNNPHGIEETKQEFAQRVFGGKVNTLRTFALKMVKESIKENEYCLRGNSTHEDKEEMEHMSRLIAEQVTWECCGGRVDYDVKNYVTARLH